MCSHLLHQYHRQTREIVKFVSLFTEGFIWTEMLSLEELGSLCDRFKISTSLRIRGNVSRLSILISISWKRKAKVNIYSESTKNSTLWVKRHFVIVILPSFIMWGCVTCWCCGGRRPGPRRTARSPTSGSPCGTASLAWRTLWVQSI